MEIGLRLPEGYACEDCKNTVFEAAGSSMWICVKCGASISAWTVTLDPKYKVTEGVT